MHNIILIRSSFVFFRNIIWQSLFHLLKCQLTTKITLGQSNINIYLTLPWAPQNDRSLQHVDLFTLHVFPHLFDGPDILLEGGAGSHDVGLGSYVERLQPVDLGGEGGGGRGHRVIQDVVLLCHDPGQAFGHLGASLNKFCPLHNFESVWCMYLCQLTQLVSILFQNASLVFGCSKHKGICWLCSWSWLYRTWLFRGEGCEWIVSLYFLAHHSTNFFHIVVLSFKRIISLSPDNQSCSQTGQNCSLKSPTMMCLSHKWLLDWENNIFLWTEIRSSSYPRWLMIRSLNPISIIKVRLPFSEKVQDKI